MENKDSLFVELFGIKAGAHGRFAIVSVLVALIFTGGAYLLGGTFGLW